MASPSSSTFIPATTSSSAWAPSDQAVERFTSIWRRLAAHYADRDPNRVFFEILNEPEIHDAYRWAGIQTRVAAAIREEAPHHTIIAAGAKWSDIWDLLAIEPLADGNVIYNFHFYEPHEFTHQGATWSTPWFSYEHGIPYPPTESSMPELLKEVPDAVSRYSMEKYWLDGWNAHRIQLMIDDAAAWGRDQSCAAHLQRIRCLSRSHRSSVAHQLAS